MLHQMQETTATCYQQCEELAELHWHKPPLDPYEIRRPAFQNKCILQFVLSHEEGGPHLHLYKLERRRGFTGW